MKTTGTRCKKCGGWVVAAHQKEIAVRMCSCVEVEEFYKNGVLIKFIANGVPLSTGLDNDSMLVDSFVRNEENQ